MCKFSSKEKNIFFKQIDRRENSQKLSLRVYWMMTGFLSGKKILFFPQCSTRVAVTRRNSILETGSGLARAPSARS